MTTQPVFSILTPVYNVEKFLPACIDSVLAQTFTNWELILVDDGSTDTSGQICDMYAAKYPAKIKVFHNTNHGLIYTRQVALSKAQGIYYIVLDSDDCLFNKTLEIIYQKFQQYRCDCVIYGFERVSENGQRIYATQDAETYVPDKRSLCRLVLFHSIYNSLWRKAMKRNLLFHTDYTPYYHIKLGEDLLQTLDILRAVDTAVLIPDILYRYTVNEESITRKIKQQPVSISFEVKEKVLEFLQQEKIFTPQDMQDYHDYCVADFQQQIKSACSHPAPMPDKIKLFKQVKQHPYYKQFLISTAYKQPFLPFYVQFRLGLFRCLVWEGQLYTFIKKYITRAVV